MTEFIPDGCGHYLDLYDSDTFWSCVNPHGGTDHEYDRLATAEGECWHWLRSEGSAYGRFETRAGQEAAHRVAWKELGRPIQDEEFLDHLCRNTKCVNPAHLEIVTHAENVRRGLQANKTHCNHGHPLDGANIIYRKRGESRIKACAICLRESRRKSMAKYRAKKRLGQ